MNFAKGLGNFWQQLIFFDTEIESLEKKIIVVKENRRLVFGKTS